MEMRTIYKLHPGDTIYLVSPEGEIKTITLNKNHFKLVNKIKPDFRYAYEYKHGMLYQIESKYNWKYHYKPDDTYIFLVTNELSAEKTEVPLFRVYDTSDYAYSSASAERVDAEKYSVFAYTTLELAQEKAKEVLAKNVKNNIAKTIKFIVVNDKDNLPIETFEDVETWNDYIKILDKYSDESIIVKLDNGKTFKQDKFEAYVLEQINEKLESVKDTFEEALDNKQENEIYSHEEAKELARKQAEAEREAKEFERRRKAFSAITEGLFSNEVFGHFHENVLNSLNEQRREVARQANSKSNDEVNEKIDGFIDELFK